MALFPIDLHFKCKILLNRNREIWYVLIYRMHKDINVFFFFQTRITQLFDLSIYSSRLWGFFSRDHVWLEWVSRVATSASYLPNKINPPPVSWDRKFPPKFFRPVSLERIEIPEGWLSLTDIQTPEMGLTWKIRQISEEYRSWYSSLFFFSSFLDHYKMTKINQFFSFNRRKKLRFFLLSF